MKIRGLAKLLNIPDNDLYRSIREHKRLKRLTRKVGVANLIVNPRKFLEALNELEGLSIDIDWVIENYDEDNEKNLCPYAELYSLIHTLYNYTLDHPSEHIHIVIKEGQAHLFFPYLMLTFSILIYEDSKQAEFTYTDSFKKNLIYSSAISQLAINQILCTILKILYDKLQEKE